MTVIRFGGTGGERVVRADGHAGYQPGNDIVCAAISAILYALAGAMLNLPCAGLMHSEESGRCMVRCTPLTDAANGAWKMAEIGLKQIAAGYPDHVRMIYDGAADTQDDTAERREEE